jgi:hypothetical protein
MKSNLTDSWAECLRCGAGNYRERGTNTNALAANRTVGVTASITAKCIALCAHGSRPIPDLIKRVF